jgi:hypothetical protein
MDILLGLVGSAFIVIGPIAPAITYDFTTKLFRKEK